MQCCGQIIDQRDFTKQAALQQALAQQQQQQAAQLRGPAGARGGKSGPVSLAQALLDPECQGIDTSGAFLPDRLFPAYFL